MTELYPETELDATNVTGDPSFLQDNDTTDFYEVDDSDSDWDARWDMSDPGADLDGTQTVECYLESFNGDDAEVTMELYEAGTQVAVLVDTEPIPGGGETFSGTFSDTDISNSADVEIRIQVATGGGMPGDRANANLGYITWTAELDVSVEVTTLDATSVTSDTATLNGELNNLTEDNADVWFEWGESGSNLENITPTQSLNSDGVFSESISDLTHNTEYEFIAYADDGVEQVSGGVQSFVTEPETVSVSLVWDSSVDDHDGERVYRAISENGEPVFPDEYTEIVDLSANTGSYQDNEAVKDEVIWYAVTAYNDGGESEPVTESIDTSSEDLIVVFDGSSIAGLESTSTKIRNIDGGYSSLSQLGIQSEKFRDVLYDGSNEALLSIDVLKNRALLKNLVSSGNLSSSLLKTRGLQYDGFSGGFLSFPLNKLRTSSFEGISDGTLGSLLYKIRNIDGDYSSISDLNLQDEKSRSILCSILNDSSLFISESKLKELSYGGLSNSTTAIDILKNRTILKNLASSGNLSSSLRKERELEQDGSSGAILSLPINKDRVATLVGFGSGDGEIDIRLLEPDILAMTLIANGSSNLSNELERIRDSILEGSSQGTSNIEQERIRRPVFDGVSTSSVDSELSRERVFNILSSSSGNASIDNKLLRTVSKAIVSDSDLEVQTSKERYVAFDGTSFGLGDITIIISDADVLDLFLNTLATGDYNSNVEKKRETTWNGVSILDVSIDNIFSLLFGFEGTSDSQVFGEVKKGREIQSDIDTSGIFGLDVDKDRDIGLFGESNSILDGDASKGRSIDINQTVEGFVQIEPEKIRAYVYSGESVDNNVEVTVVFVDEEADEIVRIVTRQLPREIVDERNVLRKIVNERDIERKLEEDRTVEWTIVDERDVEREIENEERRLKLENDT